MSNQPQTGDLLGRMFDRRYRVNELIGSGGMGSVYRATHLEMNREVALKVLERGVADTDKQVQRFYQEARASSRLQHPNTIRVFDFGRADDGRLYLAMEYLRGETLTELLKRQKRLSVDRSCHIIRQVCKSLAEAHQVGIVHRDLKPDNIFITDIYGERDFVKVLDFGIAKSTENDGQESLTQTGFICGTPRYLSPEQAMGKSIDARSDLYSVGVILFEMLSGHPPFAASTPIALVMKHIHEPPPRLPDGGKERAQWMSSLVFGLMQKVPARRPPSSVIVSQALDDIARGLQPAGLVQRSQSVVARLSVGQVHLRCAACRRSLGRRPLYFELVRHRPYLECPLGIQCLLARHELPTRLDSPMGGLHLLVPASVYRTPVRRRWCRRGDAKQPHLLAGRGL